MPKRRYQFSEEEILELEMLRKQTKDKNVDKRAKALLLYASGEKNEKIAEQTEFAKTYIPELVSRYRERGISAIGGGNYKGNHRNLSFAQEEALLEPFKQAAKEGKIVEISEIKKAYEEATGQSLERRSSQIYYVLKRHGWRKVMPRSKHPNKASEEAIEASKKLTMLSKMKWEILTQNESD